MGSRSPRPGLRTAGESNFREYRSHAVLVRRALCDRVDDGEDAVGAIVFALLEVVAMCSHGVAHVCDAHNIALACGGVGIQSGCFISTA